jgi:hypothetical protein
MAFEQLGHGAFCEQPGQRYLALGPLEYVLLVHLDHRQPPPLRVDLVMVAGERLLFVEQLDPGRQPLFTGYDIGQTHRAWHLLD